MNGMKRTLTMIAAGLAIAAPLAAWSQSQGPGPGMMGGDDYSQGMMGGGYGPGMMGGGYGPGMMGGGYGSGMMGGGYGAGMMGGGYGPGMMMGGYGPGQMGNCGPGSDRGGWRALDLTADQQTKIQGIQEEFRTKQWALMGKMREQGLHAGMMGWGRGAFDETAARKAYDEMASLRKQMFENRLEAHKRIDAVLTDKQREQLGR